MSTKPDLDFLLAEALKLVEAAKAEGKALRVMGGCAVILHIPDYGREILMKLGRDIPDLDFVTTAKRDDMKAFFQKFGYQPRERFMSLMEETRHIYDHEKTALMLDVFFEKMVMCHTIDYRKRLTVDYPTVPLAELLLQKMQIVKIGEKDIKDTIALLLTHQVGPSDTDTINSKQIAKTLADDWGFSYTITTNLRKITGFVDKYDALSAEHKATVKDRIGNLLKTIEAEPKSFKWKLRSKIGTSQTWYLEVEEVVR